MLEKTYNNYLSYITISIIISLIFAFLFFSNMLKTIIYFAIFSLILAFVSFLIISIFGSSDNGLTRKMLCIHSIFSIASILGNILFNILILLINVSPNSILSATLVGFSFFFSILNMFSLSVLLISISKL